MLASLIKISPNYTVDVNEIKYIFEGNNNVIIKFKGKNGDRIEVSNDTIDKKVLSKLTGVS